MKLIKQYLTALVIILGLTSATQAALITQDILLDGNVVGEITLNTSSSFEESGEFLLFDMFKSFTLFNRDMSLTAVDLFFAEVSGNDLYAGITTLDFDVTSTDGLAFQGAFGGPFNFLDGFNIVANSSFIFGALSLSQPATVVSEPGMALLFFSTLLIAFSRRKKYLG